MYASVDRQVIVDIIGSAEVGIAADPYERNYVAEQMCRDLRRAIGLDQRAIVRWDESARRYIVIESKKAVARARRKGA